MLSSSFKNQLVTSFSDNWGKFLIWGIVLVVLGIIAISAATMTTLISVIFLGSLLVLGGIVTIIDAFSFWWKLWSGFILLLILGILYLFAGMTLINNPILASESLTMLLGVFYIIIGLFRALYYLTQRVPGWGWGFLSGLVALLLGILILQSWPQSGLFIIGLFIGIDLLVTGWTYIMGALAARSLATKV